MNRKRVDDLFFNTPNNRTTTSTATDNELNDTDGNEFVQSYSVDFDSTDEAELSRSRGVTLFFLQRTQFAITLIV